MVQGWKLRLRSFSQGHKKGALPLLAPDPVCSNFNLFLATGPLKVCAGNAGLL